MKTESKDKPSEISDLKQEIRTGFMGLTEQMKEMHTGLSLVQADLTGVRKEMHTSLAEVRTGLTDTQHEMREKFAESIQYTKMLRHDVQESLKDVLDTINDYATHTDSEISGLKSDMRYVKGVVNTQMVTKDYLDRKFSDFEGKIGGHLRKEDDKVNELTGILTEKKVLTKLEAKKIVQMGAFRKV